MEQVFAADTNISLIEAAKKGDADAFGTLYADIRHDLYRFAYYHLGNREDAEDAVHAAVIDAFSSIRSLKSAGAFKGWILTILARKCKQIHKKRINQPKLQYEELKNTAYDAADIDSAVSLLQTVGQLDPTDRSILLLHIYCGYTCEEIAVFMKKPSSSVRSRLSRSLKKLRLQMQDD